MPDSFRIAKVIPIYKGRDAGSQHEYINYRLFSLHQSFVKSIRKSWYSQLRRFYRSALALYGAANALYWKSSERQSSTHLTVLKHQNIKTSQYKLSKNYWLIALFENFGVFRQKFQYIVSNDHPEKSRGN